MFFTVIITQSDTLNLTKSKE